MSGIEQYATEVTLQQTIDRLQRSLAQEKRRSNLLVSTVYQAAADAAAALTIPPVPAPSKDRRSKGDEIAVLLLSDWQLGKRTPTYDSDTAERRVAILRDKVEELVAVHRAGHPVKRIAIVCLGDMIEGELIFPGQHWEIDSSLFRQVTVDGPRILGDTVRWASSLFEQVDVYAVPGNHGRIGGRSSRDMHPESNGDRMLYEITKQLTENDRVRWHVTMDWWQVADLGERCRFLLAHGHQIRGFAGLPWYGFLKKVLGWGAMERLWPDMAFDHVLVGHFHTPTTMYFNGKRVWVNASTESHNPYALEQLAAAGEPAQWLLMVKEGLGVTSEHLITLSD